MDQTAERSNMMIITYMNYFGASRRIAPQRLAAVHYARPAQAATFRAIGLSTLLRQETGRCCFTTTDCQAFTPSVLSVYSIVSSQPRIFYRDSTKARSLGRFLGHGLLSLLRKSSLDIIPSSSQSIFFPAITSAHEDSPPPRRMHPT